MIALIWWGGWQLLRHRQQKTNRLGTFKMQRNGHGGTCICQLAVGVTCFRCPWKRKKTELRDCRSWRRPSWFWEMTFFPKPLGWTLAKALGWLNFPKFLSKKVSMIWLLDIPTPLKLRFSHLKMEWLEDDRFLLGWPVFRCYVSFRECQWWIFPRKNKKTKVPPKMTNQTPNRRVLELV